MKIKIFLILLFITLIGGLLRFYKLDKFPVQLNHDEISQLYDAGSIAKTGKDIYGNSLPLAFPSTGDFKVGHYIYITILPYLIFGMNEMTVRIPAAFFGTLIIPAVFLFVNQLTKNWKLAIVASAAIAITPSDIYYARKSFENVIGIFFVFSGLFLLLRELADKRRFSLFITALFLAVPMYIYTALTIVMPLTMFAFTLVFWKKIRPLYRKFLLIGMIWVMLLIPLVIITLNNSGIRFRAATVSIFQDANLTHQLQSIERNNLFLPLYQLKIIMEYSFTKYLKQFDPVHIFANGLDLTNQGLIDIGPLMLIQLPFFLLGIIYILRSRLFLNSGKFLSFFLLLSMLPSSFTFEEFSPHRSVLAFSIMSIISSFGFFRFFQVKWKNFSMLTRMSVGFILGASIILNFVYFLHIYTVNFPYEKSQTLHYPYKQVSLFAWSQYSGFDYIIVDPVYGQFAPARAVAVHYYLAYYGKYPPSKFQKDLKIDKVGMSFDKFSVREIDWSKDQLLKNTLMIASPWSIPVESIDKSKIIKEFDFYDGQPAFYAIKL